MPTFKKVDNRHSTDVTASFRAKWRLRNEPLNSILIKCHYPDVSSVFDWSCHAGNLLQPIRSTTQIWEVTRHQYGVFAFDPQTSFRGKINSGVGECRLFSWAAFKSNHRHSELTNRNVALRAAHCNSRIWICRKNVISVRNGSREKKGLYFWRYPGDCRAHMTGSCSVREGQNVLYLQYSWH